MKRTIKKGENKERKVREENNEQRVKKKKRMGMRKVRNRMKEEIK